MDVKKITIIGFALTCLAQLFVPAKMILDQENVLRTGTAYKFRTRPIDPNDPFRGKFIFLDYKDNTFPVDSAEEWGYKAKVFVEMTTDSLGFAKIKSVGQIAPASSDYFLADLSYVNHASDGKAELVINFPFDRYYMEESKAKPAESAYMEANLDTTQVVYALVHVKNGTSVLMDVVVDGQSIKDWVEQERSRKD